MYRVGFWPCRAGTSLSRQIRLYTDKSRIDNSKTHSKYMSNTTYEMMMKLNHTIHKNYKLSVQSENFQRKAKYWCLAQFLAAFGLFYICYEKRLKSISTRFLLFQDRQIILQYLGGQKRPFF